MARTHNGHNAEPPAPLASGHLGQFVHRRRAASAVDALWAILRSAFSNCRRLGIWLGVGAVGGGSVPDLRYASEAVHQRFNQIVLEGEREPLGMPSFGDRLTTEDTRKIQAFILSAARLGSTSQPEGNANLGTGAGG